MTTIRLETIINERQEVCFDLSRSLDVHQLSTVKTNEVAIDGKTSGLMEQGDTVTWRATHFLLSQTMTIRMKKLLHYSFFEDVMTKGPFKSLRHLHIFNPHANGTLMSDVFEYEVPFGIFGRWFDSFALKKHMTQLLVERNLFIKRMAESGKWKEIIQSAYA